MRSGENGNGDTAPNREEGCRATKGSLEDGEIHSRHSEERATDDQTVIGASAKSQQCENSLSETQTKAIPDAEDMRTKRSRSVLTNMGCNALQISAR
jgi:hypothetical protein